MATSALAATDPVGLGSAAPADGVSTVAAGFAAAAAGGGATSLAAFAFFGPAARATLGAFTTTLRPVGFSEILYSTLRANSITTRVTFFLNWLARIALIGLPP